MVQNLRVNLLCLVGVLITALAFVWQSVSAAPLSGTQSAASKTTDTPTTADGQAPAPLLCDIPQLQQKISLDALDQPLSDVLARLSSSLPADLSAERDVADQRVTIHLKNQSVFTLMDRLTRLLSHHPERLQGYYWKPLDRPAGTRPAFQMWRDARSVSEEANARNYPKREMAMMLRDMRNMAGMSPQDRAKYKGDYPNPLACDPSCSILALAIQGLSDDQIDALVAGVGVPLPPAAVPGLVSAAAEGKRQYRLFLTAVGKPGWPPPDVSREVPPPHASQGAPVLRVTPFGDPDNGDPDAFINRSVQEQYNVSLEGGSAFISESMLVNTYDTRGRREADKTTLPLSGTAQGTVIDLTPSLTAKTITRDQRRDIGFTLAALAQTAHLNLYQEDFLRMNATDERSGDDIPASDLSSVGLTTLKGPLPTLIAAICTHWGYHYTQVGDDYLFWSRAWAEDRADDIPESLIAPWRQRLKKQGTLTAEDKAEIASSLTLRQILLTLDQALPEAGPWTLQSYSTFRFLGQISPETKAFIQSEAGLSFGSLPPSEQEAFTSDFHSFLKNVSDDQLDDAIMSLDFYDVPERSSRVVSLTLTSGGQIIARVRGSIMLPSASNLPKKRDSDHGVVAAARGY